MLDKCGCWNVEACFLDARRGVAHRFLRPSCAGIAISRKPSAPEATSKYKAGAGFEPPMAGGGGGGAPLPPRAMSSRKDVTRASVGAGGPPSSAATAPLAGASPGASLNLDFLKP